MNIIDKIEQEQMKKDVVKFNVGDSVRVHTRVVEGEKERIQIYEGTYIARNNSGVSETITVRKLSFGTGVERIFPIHSPVIFKIDVVRSGQVRRAKLYYLRALRGKAARLKERD